METQNEEYEKKAAALIIANKELVFQNEEKEKRAAELVIANKELSLQNDEKEKRAAELIIINKELNEAKEEISEFNSNLKKEVEKRTKELEIANKTKDKFFSIIAHDLKNPFAGLLSSCELLKHRIVKQDMKKIEKYTDSIYNSSKNAYTLLENLLKWSSLQLGQIKVKKEEFDIYILINDALASIRNIAQDKEIEIEIINSGNKSCIVIFDLEMFQSIIRNLVTNAIKFSNKGEKVFIEVLDFDKNHLQVKIKDTGIGISKEDVEKLFRLDVPHTNAGTNDEKGTGLGLLLCKEFVEKNGSEIFVESQVNKGSTFSFYVEKY